MVAQGKRRRSLDVPEPRRELLAQTLLARAFPVALGRLRTVGQGPRGNVSQLFGTPCHAKALPAVTAGSTRQHPAAPWSVGAQLFQSATNPVDLTIRAHRVDSSFIFARNLSPQMSGVGARFDIAIRWRNSGEATIF